MFTLLCREQTPLSTSAYFNLQKKDMGFAGAEKRIREGRLDKGVAKCHVTS